MAVLVDVPAERAVIAGIVQYPAVYLDVADLLQETTFTVEYNKFIFSCVKRLFKNDIEVIDIPSLLSAATELGLDTLFESTPFQNHLRSVFNCAVAEKNVAKFAAKIRKLEITRLLQKKLKEASNELNTINGEETLTNILGIAENAIFDFSSLINDRDSEPHRVSSDIVEYVDYIANNPVDQVGVPTGFDEFDKAIGGGLRVGINVVAARIKVGKSMLGANIGFNIANKNVAVLNMDTELTRKEHTNRLLAMASDCFTFDIETGKFVEKPGSFARIKAAAEKIKQQNIPYFHKSIAGMPFEEQIATMRRWVVKEVGLNSDGTAKPCVIVYDYIKLMDSSGLKNGLAEFQLLGLMMTGLHNFSVRYNVPILLFAQLNRDGIDSESTAAVSGSDRIGWLCTSLTYFKKKEPEELEEDGYTNGNRKLVIIEARHGGGLDFGDYINCYFDGAKAKITEGKRKLVLLQERKNQDDEYVDDNEF